MKLFRKKKKTQNISIDSGLFDKMKEFEKRRDIITAAQRPDNVDYGYSYQNPICSSSINQSEIFLNDLITFSGKKTTWERTGSISLKEWNGLNDVIIDEYLIYVNNFTYVTLFICPYGHGPFYLPYGFLSNTGSYKSKHFANKEETTINDLKETFDSKLKSFYVENENCFLTLLAKHKKSLLKTGR